MQRNPGISLNFSPIPHNPHSALNQPDMKLRLLITSCLLAMGFSALAQGEVDVTKLVASTKNYTFSDQKSTVKGYISDELKKKTSCCGTDRIYLEVKIDPSGYVLSAKTLTGKNECMKQAAVDIVKNIKWDAADLRGAKSIYFEISPEIDCENRANAYTQVEIFNNPMLDKQGNRVYDGAVATNATPSATQPAVSQPAATQPAPTQPVAVQPAVSQPAATQPAVSQPIATTQPTPAATQLVVTQPVTAAPATQPVAATPAQVVPTVATPTTEDDMQRLAQAQEMEKLKTQLEEFRKQEAERQKKLQAQAEAAQPKPTTQQGRATAAAPKGKTQPKEENGWAAAGNLDDDYSSPAEKATAKSGAATPPQETPKTAVDQTRDELTRLEQQRRELEQNRQQKMDEQRRAEMATQDINQNLIRLEEEILRKQEVAEQQREQRELDQIEQDRLRAEDQRRKEQDEYQRMMDEIARLQREAEDKIKGLEDQKADLERMSELKQKREQEIVLQRAIREKEQETRLAQMRLELAGSNLASAGQDPLSGLVITDQDSDKVSVLINQLQLLRQELIILQDRIDYLEGTPGSTKPKTGTNPGGVSTPGQTSTGRSVGTGTGVQNAATNKSWEKTDNGVEAPPAPVVPQSTPAATTPGTKPSTPAQVGYRPGIGYSPDPSNADTHDNIEILLPAMPAYQGGDDAMKNYLAEELHKVGVCGLAQAAFTVTVNPAGQVVDGAVLKANTPLVQAQMTNLLRTLKFSPFQGRVNQNLVLEFKGDIRCGTGESVNLQEVKPMIKN